MVVDTDAVKRRSANGHLLRITITLHATKLLPQGLRFLTYCQPILISGPADKK